MTRPAPAHTAPGDVESAAAWLRLGVALLVGTIACVGMWSVSVALPAIQAEFGVARGDASLPYTFAMIGFGAGAVLHGRIADGFGIVSSLILGAVTLALGYAAISYATSIWQYALLYCLVGFGGAAGFGPLIADISHWFSRRRGIAVTIAASGNYLAGVVWPPIVHHFIETVGWRATHFGIGVLCLVTILPLTLLLRRRLPAAAEAKAGVDAALALAQLGISSGTLQKVLMVAGIACCIAMAIPQAHIVAYCGDLGYGAARGAEMLSLMLAAGIVSRIASGFVADRIGGLATLLIGSTMQSVALFLYLWFDGLTSLYVITILFGAFQGGIQPMYAVIAREYFPPEGAATRYGVILSIMLIGMAVGGWTSGAIFDLTGAYGAAFLHGLLWNLVNVLIVVWLILRPGRRTVTATSMTAARS
jgi:MFS family permease